MKGGKYYEDPNVTQGAEVWTETRMDTWGELLKFALPQEQGCTFLPAP